MILVFVYLLATVLFLALLLSLGVQPKLITRLTGVILFVTGVLGTALYGYAYSVLFPSVPQAVIRTLFSVFCMFLGRNEIGAISAVPALQTPGMQLLIYAVHLMALYTTASAMAASVGARLIRRLHLFLARRGKLRLIFGGGDEALAFAAGLEKTGGVNVFVGRDAALDGKILRMGSLLFTDSEALGAEPAFLKRIGMGRGSRRLELYCLDRSYEENLRYAGAMARNLEALGVASEQTALTVLLEDESDGAALQAGEGRYGFGTVLALPRSELTARLMLRLSPPHETMTFDAAARATEDFDALVVGFGQTGQAALRSLVMNGQFEGSRFHATVVAKGYREQAGSFFYRYPGLQAHYEIDFIDDNARSVSVYDHIRNHCANLNFVALCTGSETENREIAGEYQRLFADLGVRAPILLCTDRGVERLDAHGRARQALFSPELLQGDSLDRMAMALNHQYHLAEGRTAREDWQRCDYFSRMSCRASADFLDAFLHAAGTDRKRVLEQGFDPQGDVLENLGRTEHLRWCAFHYAMGYEAMPPEIVAQRGAQYAEEKARTGKSSLRIGKDAENRQHACLIPWEALDELAETEAGYTGVRKDYKKMDIDNVRMIPDMLRQEAGA